MRRTVLWGFPGRRRGRVHASVPRDSLAGPAVPERDTRGPRSRPVPAHRPAAVPAHRRRDRAAAAGADRRRADAAHPRRRGHRHRHRAWRRRVRRPHRGRDGRGGGAAGRVVGRGPVARRPGRRAARLRPAHRRGLAGAVAVGPAGRPVRCPVADHPLGERRPAGAAAVSGPVRRRGDGRGDVLGRAGAGDGPGPVDRAGAGRALRGGGGDDRAAAGADVPALRPAADRDRPGQPDPA